MTKAELGQCAVQLRALLEEIDGGRLDASTGQITYLRGALDAVEMVAQRRPLVSARSGGREQS
jgi:hypothetical protein